MIVICRVTRPTDDWWLSSATAPVGNPTYGHYVAWIGTYDDIRHESARTISRQAAAQPRGTRLRLLRPRTLARWLRWSPRLTSSTNPGPEKHSIVSVRFKLEEIDAAFERKLLGASDEQLKILQDGQKAGLIELKDAELYSFQFATGK